MKNIFISFSGGKTSAYMAWKMLRDNPNENYLFLFANTGQEHSETYKFIDRVRKWLSIDLKIVEPVFTKKGTEYKQVEFDKMCRHGDLFEGLVSRYGIPNKAYPHCTRELKIIPMHKFAKAYFNGEDYLTAMGIRSDEIDRVSSKMDELGYIYPLAWDGTTKKTVNEFWKQQDFNLEIPEHLGNCVWCWKKSFSKHEKILRDNESFYDVPKYLEEKYQVNDIKTQIRCGSVQKFFRGNQSFVELKKEYTENEMERLKQGDLFSGYLNSCKESCGE